MKRQQGVVLVFALLILLSLTIVGVSAVSSSLNQSKMATSMQQSGLAFDAAEAGLAGVFFESEDEVLLTNAALLDPLSQARQGDIYDPQTEQLSCRENVRWTNRQMTSAGLNTNTIHVAAGDYQSEVKTRSWSRTAFVREQACRGSSNVIGGSNINCHVFVVRGCGQVDGRSTIIANSVSAAVLAPASN
ncbi:pilus assembly PilX family protein [Salinimonas sediminis]|uniref:Pilus assembly protein PilZ n=1 Tax=Salinimonas sediminis TaxID=2303538 RepID=A0A346NNW5_9ALTE|nr:pilus assembly PilX N-terminal domain-containing protein [Salinimonas sediminis]AXR07222.1 pilus assembly protein PilZ [Salinimonas sediminis]